jgi:hypothetical protein
MNILVLNKYYNANRALYQSLVLECTSVPELVLKINIFGKKWSHWDWSALILEAILNQAEQYDIWLNTKNEKMNNHLYVDLVQSASEKSIIEKVFTNNRVMQNIVAICIYSQYPRSVRVFARNLAAQIFKRHPKMWTMSWMYSKHKIELNGKTKTTKIHKMRSIENLQCQKHTNDLDLLKILISIYG